MPVSNKHLPGNLAIFTWVGSVVHHQGGAEPYQLVLCTQRIQDKELLELACKVEDFQECKIH